MSDLFRPQKGKSTIMWYNCIKVFFFPVTSKGKLLLLLDKVHSKFLIVKECLRSEAEVVCLHPTGTWRPQASGFCCLKCRISCPGHCTEVCKINKGERLLPAQRLSQLTAQLQISFLHHLTLVSCGLPTSWAW